MGNFDFSVITRVWPYLLQGLGFTLEVTLVATVGGIVLGTLLALGRLSPVKPLSLACASYVNLMRSVPLILVIFWFFFLVPSMLGWLIGSERPVEIGTTRTALITFTLFEAAYFCEVVRAGIQSVPRGQVSAASALGLTYFQSMRIVILPQAFRAMLPVLLTQTVILFQDTSLLYVISATDFLGAASKIAQRDGRLVEMYSFVAIAYFAMCYGMSTLVKKYQKRLNRHLVHA
ncbi:amino acid ABC transporter permease [Rhodoferax ferrireducens]|uniref:amino acid ABC transporter permease n=1 Tax=Rhodoferax ferrireducens TaxID=192843 RepID=UPI000E0D3F80|nr:amino acid ABC transporter permease [Rhodoferax ferrireducens]